MTGQIFNIQKYALHDGPGIRTTVFFKGCPLKCAWCHNPESIKSASELTMNEDKCISCKHCSDFTDPEPCPTLALERVGKSYEADQLLTEILKDVVFYDQSHGGVTFSGGEPLMQASFLLEMLKLCHAHNVHTTLDTTGYAKWSAIEPLLPYVDLILYDLKHLDDTLHQSHTGVSNKLILENFKRIIETNDVYVRVPLIKGFNDDDENIRQLIEVSTHEHVLQINLLPYHAYAENKYDHLVQKTEFQSFAQPSEKRINEIVQMCQSHDIKTYIGG